MTFGIVGRRHLVLLANDIWYCLPMTFVFVGRQHLVLLANDVWYGWPTTFDIVGRRRLVLLAHDIWYCWPTTFGIVGRRHSVLLLLRHFVFQKVEGRVTSHCHSITSKTRNPCAHTGSYKTCMQTRELTLILINGNDKTFRRTTPSSVV